MIAYKVVVKGNEGHLVSYTATGSLAQTYKPNERVTAKIGGFLCFKTKKAAKTFKAHKLAFGEIELWKVEVSESVLLPNCRLVIGVNLKNAKHLWCNQAVGVFSAMWPKGTVAYKHVTLKEKMG